MAVGPDDHVGNAVAVDIRRSVDRATQLAIGAGIDALRDSGIPLLMHYKTTTTGSKLPERWLLPETYHQPPEAPICLPAYI